MDDLKKKNERKKNKVDRSLFYVIYKIFYTHIVHPVDHMAAAVQVGRSCHGNMIDD